MRRCCGQRGIQAIATALWNFAFSSTSSRLLQSTQRLPLVMQIWSYIPLTLSTFCSVFPRENLTCPTLFESFPCCDTSAVTSTRAFLCSSLRSRSCSLASPFLPTRFGSFWPSTDSPWLLGRPWRSASEAPSGTDGGLLIGCLSYITILNTDYEILNNDSVQSAPNDPHHSFSAHDSIFSFFFILASSSRLGSASPPASASSPKPFRGR